MHGTGKYGHREYCTPDGKWRLYRTVKPRAARLHLEDTTAQAQP